MRTEIQTNGEWSSLKEDFIAKILRGILKKKTRGHLHAFNKNEVKKQVKNGTCKGTLTLIFFLLRMRLKFTICTVLTLLALGKKLSVLLQK